MENKEIKSLRIKNLEFKKASYLGPEPEVPSYHINFWSKNEYYGKEHEYLQDGDFFKRSKDSICKIHKSCFTNPETCFAIASFTYDLDYTYYNFSFVGPRPLSLTEEEKEIFWQLINYGYQQLNNY